MDRPRRCHLPEMIRETLVGKARRLMSEELSAVGLKETDLPDLPKGVAIKIGIAMELRKSTALTYKEIASLLHAGNWRSLANALSQVRAAQSEESDVSI